MNGSEDIEQIKALYFKDPTSLPTAFWKYENWLSHPALKMDKVNRSTTYTLDNKIILTDRESISEDTMDDAIDIVVSKMPQSLGNQWCEEVYFKLYHSNQNETTIETCNFRFEEVNNDELDEVLKFIIKSYENTDVRHEDIKSWRESALFDSSLWIWLVDIDSNDKIALGICEIDKRNKEGALEWIQVHASYRGKGYGKALVNELLRRMREKVEVVTVSGELGNKSNPEQLYRSCGFIGNHNWYVYKKK